MKLKNIFAISLVALFAFLSIGCSSNSVSTESGRRQRDTDARRALAALYSSTPGARDLGNSAKGILVFPSIVKGGFMIGGQFGEGVLFKGDQASGYYSSVSGSFGLQAGLQKFGYVLFFMTDSDLSYLNKSEGWEIGVGPTVTVLDQGFARSMTSTTLREGVYSFFFNQEGLMAGLGLQGTKITRID